MAIGDFEKIMRRFYDFERSLKFNPLIYWTTLAWCASKVLQWLVQSDKTIWEKSWNWFLDTFGDDELYLIVYGTGILSYSLTIFISSLFLFMDITLKPESLRKYKVQLHTNEPADPQKVRKTLLMILSQTVINIPFGFCFYYMLYWRGIPNMRRLESFPTATVNVLICALTYEICFYTSHRLMHYKIFYKHIHKIHHEWTSSIAIAAFYSHPIEHLLVNLGSIFGGVVLTGCHIATAWLWVWLFLISTLGDHSGYHVPFLHSAEFHDYHHLNSNVNYGASGLMDSICGTDKIFRHTVNETRHRTLFSLRSARERFPDPSADKND